MSEPLALYELFIRNRHFIRHLKTMKVRDQEPDVERKNNYSFDIEISRIFLPEFSRIEVLHVLFNAIDFVRST
jgi:hypothetical protein